MDIRHLTGRLSPDRIGRKHTNKPAGKTADGASFSEVLGKVESEEQIHFSGHARKRIEDRSIKLDRDDLQRLSNAMDKAYEKGSRESLILDGDKAFVVNIPNRTVITAVDLMELKNRVFTNIDSTVFAG